MKKILLSNSIASAGSIFWSALLQIISVPILLSYWGKENYGVWLMLSAIPTYIALSDLGLGAAATSEMRINYVKLNFIAVSRIFNSVLVLTILIGSGAVVIGFLGVFFLGDIFSKNFMQSYGISIIELIIYAGAAMISRIYLAAFRAADKYAYGTILYDFIQFLEGGTILLTAIFGYNHLTAALFLLVSRFFLIFIMHTEAARNLKLITINFNLARKSEIRNLIKPALSAFAIPTSLAVNMQGMVLVAGAVISPVAVAILTPTRTISRIVIQLVGIVNRATVPEFSSCYAKNDVLGLRKLIKINSIVVCVILLPGTLIFGLFGNKAVEVWSGGVIKPSQEFVALIALSMFLHGCWYFGTNLLLAVSLHQKMAVTLLLSSFVAIIFGYILSSRFGLDGIAAAVVLGELIACIRLVMLIFEVKHMF